MPNPETIIPNTSYLSTTADPDWQKTTCPYCGVGCGVEAKVDKEGKVTVRGDESHPANYGRLCSKGLALGDTLIDDGRLLEPSIGGKTVDWNTAIAHVGDKFSKTIKKYGPDSVALYVSGQILTEDYYVANKLMKGYIGSGNIDTNSRLCMSSSVAGHKRAFGTDTVPNCYDDFELADLVVLVGSNLAWCHPVIYQRLKAAKESRPELKIVVIDPRETDSCELADLHLAIQPGSDVALFNGLLSYLSENKCLDHRYINEHTLGFADTLATAKFGTGDNGVDFLSLSRITGLPIAYIETFYQWFAKTDKVLSVYSQGVNQSSAGSDKVNSIINCHLATGRIGREGCGPFSITGQPNAMGGREVGGLANTLASHMDFGNNEHWKIVSDFWQTDNLAKKPGLKAVELFDAVAAGKIKAIWIMATNPVVSLPNADAVKRALEACPLVVVSDCIADTDTTRCADVLLPAMGWGEKSGTVTNSERRISRQRQLIATDTQAKPDWWALSQVALRMGYAGFNFTCAADVFREYANMTGFRNNEAGSKRDLDISPLADISNLEYDQLSPQQWPLSKTGENKQVTGRKRFFADGQFFSETGKANLVPVSYRPPKTEISHRYPMVLNTGRIRDQWHTMTRTGLAPQLGAHKPEPFVQINPQDARCFSLNDGDIAELSSEWGTAKARVSVSIAMNPGQLFMPIHWSAVASSNGRVCPLISPDVDPISGQPESKFTPVAIKRWEFSSEGLMIIRDSQSIEDLDLKQFDYWVKRKIQAGTLYYLASTNTERPLSTQLQALSIFNGEGNSITFDSPHTCSYRSAIVVNGDLIATCITSTRINSDDYAWLDGLFTRPLDVDIQRSILSGIAADSLISGKQICACKQVGELTIQAAIEVEGCSNVEAIGKCTHAGTGCGSCIPEIKQMLEQSNNKDLATAV